jgi:hypothetical protein
LPSGNFGVFNAPRLFRAGGGWLSSSSLGTAADLRAARFEEPVRGVLPLATLDDAVDGRGLGVTADLRGARFFMGDSPLIPRASKMSASGFPSEGTKMLVYVE